MNIHFIQSDPIVLPANAGEWAHARNHQVKITHVYNGEPLPHRHEFDLVIILGGRMGAYEEEKHPWLRDIKAWVKDIIEADKYVLGICLGAQIIADALGGSVRPHDYPEVGWYPIQFDEKVNDHPLLTNLQPPTHFFEFHFDTFDIPPGSELLAGSSRCERQMFAVGSRVLGLQFHPEFNSKSIQATIKLTKDSQMADYYAQAPIDMGDEQKIELSKTWLFELLDAYAYSISIDKK